MSQHVYEIEPVAWGRVGRRPDGWVDCLLRFPNVGAVMCLECPIMPWSDIISDPETIAIYIPAAKNLKKCNHDEFSRLCMGL